MGRSEIRKLRGGVVGERAHDGGGRAERALVDFDGPAEPVALRPELLSVGKCDLAPQLSKTTIYLEQKALPHLNR